MKTTSVFVFQTYVKYMSILYRRNLITVIQMICGFVIKFCVVHKMAKRSNTIFLLH